MKNAMSLEFPAVSENEPFARGAVAACCMRLNPTLDELSDVKTAVSEAVTNCIVHAYGNGEGLVCIECEAGEDTLHIKISDKGRGIGDVAQAIEPFYTTSENEERSGMGFTIMQTFMTSFALESTPGKGTVVTMSKQFGKQGSGARPACVGAVDAR